MLDDSHIDPHYKTVLEQFRGFLRSLMMHAGVGTALGGVMTMVGEPQNLIIAKAAGWHFGDFFADVACHRPGTGMWTVNLYAGRENALVWLWRNVARKSPRRLAAIRRSKP